MNKKSLEDIINAARKKINKPASKKSFDTKVSDFVEFLKEEVVNCLNEDNVVRGAAFIVVNYNKTSHLTVVYKVIINYATKDKLTDNDFSLITTIKQSNFTVVCDGQNRISERILWGDLDTVLELIPKVAKKIFLDFKIDKAKIPKDYIEGLTANKEVLPESYYEEMKILKLKELSLQQAINLACLLMRLERDMQKYTENIPTVGGNVKIAVIDDKGFRFVSGDNLNVESFKNLYMKTTKKTYTIDYDINKAYEMLVQTSDRVQIEKKETEQQIEKDIIRKSLENLLKGKEVIVENSYAHR